MIWTVDRAGQIGSLGEPQSSRAYCEAGSRKPSQNLRQILVYVAGWQRYAYM